MVARNVVISRSFIFTYQSHTTPLNVLYRLFEAYQKLNVIDVHLIFLNLFYFRCQVPLSNCFKIIRLNLNWFLHKSVQTAQSNGYCPFELHMTN